MDEKEDDEKNEEGNNKGRSENHLLSSETNEGFSMEIIEDRERGGEGGGGGTHSLRSLEIEEILLLN